MSKRDNTDSIHSDIPPKVARPTDVFVPQTPIANSLSNNPGIIRKGDGTVAHDEESTKKILSIIENSKPRSTIQGELYNTYLAISIIIHQFKKKNNFIVATEVSVADKFDDIVCHCQSSTGTSTLYIQAKHKKKSGYFITQKELCTNKDAYSIPMYFLSFLEIDKNLSGGESTTRKDAHKTRYAICTNVDFHTNIKQYCKKIVPQKDDALQFYKDIGATCYQISRNIPALTESLRKSCKEKLPTDSEFHKQKNEFFGKFLFICNSCNQEELRKKTATLLPKWCDKGQRATVIDKLEALLNNNVYNEQHFYVDLAWMQKWFLEIDVNQNFRDLNRFTKEHVGLVYEKHANIEMLPVYLKDSNLCAFLEGERGCGVFAFKSTLDLTVSSRILHQTLTLLQNTVETLFVDSAKYASQQDMNDILDNVLSYLRDVNHPTIKVITILAKCDRVCISEIEKLSEKYRLKIVVVAKLPKSPPHEAALERILVRHLSDKASCQLYKQAVRMMFGTNTPLSSIVEDTDDLSFLLDVLKHCDEWRDGKSHNLNMHNYEKIRPWYVQRHFVPYEQQEREENFHDSKYISTSDVQSALASNGREPVPPVFLEGDTDNVFIFLNDAGLGKTTYFTWLAWYLSTSDTSRYVIKLIALEYSTDFGRLVGTDLQCLGDTETVRLLYTYIHLALHVTSINSRNIKQTDEDRRNAERCADLLTLSNNLIVLDEARLNQLSTEELIELRLFRAKFNQRKLVLILDGFDEITPYYKMEVMECFAKFARLKGVQSLHLSSRPYGFEKELKQVFGYCQMFQLSPYSEQDIIRSCDKFLVNNLDGYMHYEQQDRNNILVELYNFICRVSKDLITIPLLLYMVQIILLPEISNHLKRGTHELSGGMLSNVNIDLLYLVEQFIERKIKILSTDKTGTTDSSGTTAAAKKSEERSRKRMKKQHILLAMYVIFDQVDRSELLSEDAREEADEIMEEVNQGDEKTGIVLGVQNGVPQFLHRTFAEYFTACWLFDNWKKFKNGRIFRSHSLWSPSLRETREFFDRLILRQSEGCEIHLAVVNKSRKRIQEILLENPTVVTNMDMVGRLPFHFVHYLNDLYDGNEENKHFQSVLTKLDEIKLLFNCVPQDLEVINRKDLLYGWNALDYTIVANVCYLVNVLDASGVKHDMDNLSLQVCSNNIDVLLTKETDYRYIFVDVLKRKDLAEELSKRVAAHLIAEHNQDIYAPLDELKNKSLLELTIDRDNISVACHLITKSGSQQNTEALRLFGLSLDYKLHEITISFVEQHPQFISSIDDQRVLFLCAKRAVEKNQVELFQIIFRKFCIVQNIAYVAEDNLIDDFSDQSEKETFGIKLLFEGFCCYKEQKDKENEINSEEEADEEEEEEDGENEEEEEHNMEGLLYTAIRCNHVHMASYILQKTGMDVTVDLIKIIMHRLRSKKRKGKNHKTCIPAFKFLFKKLYNLYAVDAHDGLDLFFVIIKYGCVYMLHSLVAIGFDAKNINMEKLRNVFCYNLSKSDHRYLANVCVYLQQRPCVDFFNSYGPESEALFHIEVREKRFTTAQALVQDKYRALSCSEREHVVLDLLLQLLLKYEDELIIDFIKSLLQQSSTEGEMKCETWHSVYSSIFQPKLNKLHFFEKLIHRNIEYSYTDKAANNDKDRSNKELIKEQHMLLAMRVVFEHSYRELLSGAELQRSDELMASLITKTSSANEAEEMQRIVIVGVKDGVPQFLLSTFAHYFAACWLCENVDIFRCRGIIFRSQTFWASSLKKTREFFDRLILRQSEDCDLHLALVNKSPAEIKQLLDIRPSAVNVKDTLGRLPLHFLHYLVELDEEQGTPFYRSILNKLDEVNRILQCDPNGVGDLEFMNQKDLLYGWNALDYAFVLNERDLVGALYARGITLNMDILLQQVCSNDGAVLLAKKYEYRYIFVECLVQMDRADKLCECVAERLVTAKQSDDHFTLAKLESLSVMEPSFK